MLKLKDVVGILQKLSLVLQKYALSLSAAYTRVHATLELLKSHQIREDPDVLTVLNLGEYESLTLTFKCYKSKASNELIGKIMKCIEARFPPDHLPIVEASMISCFNNWPALGSDSIQDYGSEKVKCIQQQFGAILPKSGENQLSSLLEEWTLLKHLLYKNLNYFIGNKLVTGQLLWEEAFRSINDQGLEIIPSCIDLLRSLPPTSVKNETTFSSMKLLKTKRRGRMSTGRLIDLMLVHLESPSIEDFNPKEAVQEWMVTPSGRSRRLQYNRTVTQTASCSEPILGDNETRLNIEQDTSNFNLEEQSKQSKSISDSDNDSADSDFFDGDDGDEAMEMSYEHVFSLLNSFCRE